MEESLIPHVDVKGVRSEHHVHMNFRYSCAWSEYNQRMMARHQVLTLYLTASTVTLGFLYAHRQETSFNFWEVALVLPAASMIASLLLYMHDCMMSNLHEFLIVCENHNNIRTNESPHLPSYHSSWEGATRFLCNRQLQDYTILFIYTIFNVSPFYFLPGSKRREILFNTSHLHLYIIIYIFGFVSSWILIMEGRARRVESVRRHIPNVLITRFHRRAFTLTRRVFVSYVLVIFQPIGRRIKRGRSKPERGK